jgi:hypothetical protein
MERLYWVFLVGPSVIYLSVNIFYSGFLGLWENFIGIGALNYFSAFIGLCVIHESLHVLGGMMVGAKLKSFKFGFDENNLSIICGCQDEMTVKGYQLLLSLPFLLLTPLLVSLAFLTEEHIWWHFLMLSTSGCAFDLTVLMALIGIPGRTKIIPDLSGEDGLVFLKTAS